MRWSVSRKEHELNRSPARCPQCKSRFTPEERGLRIHPDCVDAWYTAHREKQAKKAEAKRKKDAAADKRVTRDKLEKLKTLTQHKADTQRAINAWIVHVRDQGRPCISCGAWPPDRPQAGHYRTRGSAPHLALDERNIALQCSHCNLHLHGNPIAMRRGLVMRHGEAFVLALESDQAPRKYTVQQLQDIAAHYRKLVRDANKSASCQEHPAP